LDLIDHGEAVALDGLVLEPQDVEALGPEPLVAAGVVDGVVEGAVGFHNQSVGETEKSKT
jgi:hypothetical protein